MKYQLNNHVIIMKYYHQQLREVMDGHIWFRDCCSTISEWYRCCTRRYILDCCNTIT
jgi:hypothetical protein